MPVSVSGVSGNSYQARYGLLRAVLRELLADVGKSPRSVAELDWAGYSAGAALDALLAAHPVDRHGRCRSCRRRGVTRRRPVCLILVQAQYWLRQPARLT
ncbi:MAG TPA: hypothetical protein VFO16_18655 [Pseudonocardiaceae bacterium]|nr:hypothetical protein [Pseudonocardiaceae bacterium]